MPAIVAELICESLCVRRVFPYWDEFDIPGSGNAVAALDGPNGTSLAVLPQVRRPFEVTMHLFGATWGPDPAEFAGREAKLAIPGRFVGRILIESVRTRATPILRLRVPDVLRTLTITAYPLDALI